MWTKKVQALKQITSLFEGRKIITSVQIKKSDKIRNERRSRRLSRLSKQEEQEQEQE